MDSNVDRTRQFVEGYLQYWETILFLEEEGVEIGRFLPQ